MARVLPGAFGVTLFFFISGYLITRQLSASLRATGRIDYAGFYLRRALRLMPAGLTYIVVAGAAFQLAGGHISSQGWVAALLYGANYYDLWAGYHSTLQGVRHPFNILWSLAVEEHFYLLWPVLLPVLQRSRHALALVLALCGAVLLWRLTLLHACFVPGADIGVCGPPNPNPVWRYNRLYLPTDARLDSIAWGALLALLETRLPAAMAARLQSNAAFMGGLILLAGSFALTGAVGRYGLRPSVQGLALVAVIPCLVWRAPAQWGRVQRMLCWPAAVLIGRLSYSLYLWHWGALGVADYLAPASPALWLTIAVPLSCALAAASYAIIEQPMLRLRHRFGSHAPLSLTGGGTQAALGAAALAEPRPAMADSPAAAVPR